MLTLGIHKCVLLFNSFHRIRAELKTHWRIRQVREFEKSFGQLRRVPGLLVIVLIRECLRFAGCALIVVDLDSGSCERTRVHEISSEKSWLNEGDVNAEGLQLGVKRFCDAFNGKSC